MNIYLDVIKLEITDDEVIFLRIPRGKENEFCTGVRERYPLSKQVKININRNKKSDSRDKEKQQFQLGDTAYMIDEDYRLFESEVYRIELKNGKYYYETRECDFKFKDIGNWVFKSELHREMHFEVML